MRAGLAPSLLLSLLTHAAALQAYFPFRPKAVNTCGRPSHHVRRAVHIGTFSRAPSQISFKSSSTGSQGTVVKASARSMSSLYGRRSGYREDNASQQPADVLCLREALPESNGKQVSRALRIARVALPIAAVAALLVIMYAAPGPAAAAARDVQSAAEEHLHVGQKIANFFRRSGLPDWATLMVISAMPVVELRGGVPVGIWMGMPIAKTFALCVTGNMLPIPIILFALRSKLIQRLAKPILDRARSKAQDFGDEKSQAFALTLFVGIPLPGTGAWTGAMGAFLLGMPFRKAMLSILLGVLSAGGIMSCLTLAGRTGAFVATAVLAVFCISSIAGSGPGKTKASDFTS